MCGIIGIAGIKSFKAAFEGLKSLEYRGYDSFGFGALIDNELTTLKKIGAISDYKQDDFSKFNSASTVVGHTRWATHGSVTEGNSHPHTDINNTLLIAHNGVIANFASLKSDNPDWVLSSETDTEVAANVLADELASNKGNVMLSLQLACERLEGEFAICGVIRGAEDKIFVIKRKSPLILAKYKKGVIVSSDRTALAEFSDTIDMTYIADDTAIFFDGKNIEATQLNEGGWVKCELAFHSEDLASSKSDLGNFPHFMLKEMSECSNAAKSIQASLEPFLGKIIDEINVSDFSLTGSGSAFYVGMIGQYFFKSLANKYVSAHPSDEFLNVKPLTRRDAVLGISQSGETFDTLEVMREAKEKKAFTIALNNVDASSMQRISDIPVFQNSGKEVCVLSTKSIVSQVAALYLMSNKLGQRSGQLSEAKYSSNIEDFNKLPSVLSLIFRDYSNEIRRVAYQNSKIEHWFFIGRGAHYPVALESALKFKEVSYLHAEGMSAGFFKHGTISLIDDNFYTVVFLPSKVNDPDLHQMTIDNIYEIRAREGKVIGFGHQIPRELRDDLFFEYIELPDINPELNIVSQLLAGQLFAYYCALSLNRNIDRPRALAKSVTVR
jgi:glucosamine--fructose-6-phosphate aminotransferase (isomerizing)